MKNKVMIMTFTLCLIIELICIVGSLYLIQVKDATFMSGINIILATLTTVWLISIIKKIK